MNKCAHATLSHVFHEDCISFVFSNVDELFPRLGKRCVTRKSHLDSVLIWTYLSICTVRAVLKWGSRCLAKSVYCRSWKTKSVCLTLVYLSVNLFLTWSVSQSDTSCVTPVVSGLPTEDCPSTCEAEPGQENKHRTLLLLLPTSHRKCPGEPLRKQLQRNQCTISRNIPSLLGSPSAGYFDLLSAGKKIQSHAKTCRSMQHRQKYWRVLSRHTVKGKK